MIKLRCLLAGVLMYGFAAQARQPSVPDEALITVELATVAVVPMSGSPVVLLREPESGDVIPIFVGPGEANAILRALAGMQTPRPLTHDLMRDLLDAAGARVQRVVVDDLRNDTYYGLIELRLQGSDRPVWVDTRPSDALALALRTGARIEVSPKVMQAAIGIPWETMPGEQVVTAVGITVVEATPELRKALELPDTPGVLVSGVSGDAQAAGLQSGSLILSVNGQTPRSPMEFLELVRRNPYGEKARIDYWQQGGKRSMDLSTQAAGATAPARRVPERAL
jgi:uncharacterized protein